MTRINSEGYRPLRNDDDQPQRVLGKTFFVHLAGKTNGAHGDFIQYLTSNGKVEVESYAASDFLVVICPVVSRVGTDIEAALSNNSVLTDGKPTLLVVMHHTFDRNHVVAESRRQVSDSRVWLTVDCLFHQGKLLQHCPLNDAMRVQVGNFLGFSFCSKIPTKWYVVGAVVGVVVGVLVVVSVIVPLIYTWNKNNQNQTANDILGMN